MIFQPKRAKENKNGRPVVQDTAASITHVAETPGAVAAPTADAEVSTAPYMTVTVLTQKQ